MKTLIPVCILLFQLVLGTATAQCNFDATITTTEALCNNTPSGALDVELSDFAFPGVWILSGVGPTRLDSIFQNNFSIPNVDPRSNTLVLIDANDCSRNVNFSVQNPPLLVTQTIRTILPDCSNDSLGGFIEVIGSGGTPPYTYAWEPNVSTTNIANNLPIGDYQVTVTDANGCQAVSGFGLNGAVNIRIDVLSNNCSTPNSGSLEAVANGTPPYDIQWSTGDTTAVISDLGAGIYRVTVVDALGCQSVEIAEIEGNGDGQIFNLQVIVVDPACGGIKDGQILVDPECGIPPYTFNWSDDRLDGMSAVSNLAAGFYVVTVQDALGNQEIQSFSLTSPSDLEMILTEVQDVSCFGGSDGLLKVQVAGGVPPYSYSWSTNNSSTNCIVGMSAGDYSVTVTDNNGCTIESLYTVSEPEDAVAVTIEVDQFACNNEGALAAIPMNGLAPYTYLWSNGQTDSIATGLSSSNHSLTVTDANGCFIIEEYFLDGQLALQVSSTTADCDSLRGTAMASVSDSVANPQYSWSNGGTGPVQTNLLIGGYSVTVVDPLSGCRSHRNVFVERDDSCFVVIAGTISIDLDQNCQPDSSYQLSGILVELSDGQTAVTNFNGAYEFQTTPGTYTVKPILDTARYSNVCGDSLIVDAPDWGNVYGGNDFYFGRRYLLDLGLRPVKPDPRPGFVRTLIVDIVNFSDGPEDGTLTYTYDVRHEYIDASIQPTTHDVANRKLTWELTDIPRNTSRLQIQMRLPATVPLGTIIDYHFSIEPIDSDFNPADNEVFCQRVVVGSFDPNDKSAEQAGRGTNGLLDFGVRELGYLVRFQNTGTDTAFTVVIRDTLDTDLDLKSLVPGPASHPYELKVYDSRVLEFTFNDILLPDSTTNKEGSNGHVFFDIRFKEDAPPGTRAENKAAIFFDFNKPIITNTVVRTLRAADVFTELDLQGCDSLLYNGQIYTDGAMVVDTFQLAIRDSIVTASIEIFQDVTTTVNVPLQSGDVYQGNVYLNDTTLTEVLTANNGCDSIIITEISILTNANDLANENWQVNVFPNPSSGLFQVLLEGDIPLSYTWMLIDVQGRVIQINQTESRNVDKFELDLTTLPNGIYQFLLRSKEQLKTKRLVKID
ncbi:MAG: T9SS type A sorting domain-containing protein [Bacteroidota bacterium]